MNLDVIIGVIVAIVGSSFGAFQLLARKRVEQKLVDERRKTLVPLTKENEDAIKKAKADVEKYKARRAARIATDSKSTKSS